jgi:hypothetical protein
MSDNNLFKDIRIKRGDTEKSYRWYQDQIRNLLRKNPVSPNSRDLLKDVDHLRNIIVPGKMYLFLYDAKHKDTLPYWDMFPLVLPFRKVEDGFYGINLHYLSYPLRFKLLETLNKNTINKALTEDAKIKISWEMLLTMSRIAPVKACVKHYLTDHVESRFLNIPHPDWVTAAMLPVERFVGASKEKVWRDSRRMF